MEGAGDVEHGVFKGIYGAFNPLGFQLFKYASVTIAEGTGVLAGITSDATAKLALPEIPPFFRGHLFQRSNISVISGITLLFFANQFFRGKRGGVLVDLTGVRFELIYRDCMALIVSGNDIVAIFFHNINRIRGVGKACFNLFEINDSGTGKIISVAGRFIIMEEPLGFPTPGFLGTSTPSYFRSSDMVLIFAN